MNAPENFAPQKDEKEPGQGFPFESNNNQHLESSLTQPEQVKPTVPSLNTQPHRMLQLLLLDQKIDPLDGWSALGIYRLSDTVLQLRKAGWPVITGRKHVKNRFGEECCVAEYYLPPAVTAEWRPRLGPDFFDGGLH